MVRITLNNGATSVTINKFVLLVFGLLCSTLSLFAQTDSCSTSPDGEVIVNGTSCSFVTFNKSFDARNGNAYWLNTALAACNAATSVDTWGWFTAISTSTTIRYESTELGVAPILHLFNQCNPIMSDIGCAYNPGTGLAEVTIATVIGQAYHFRLQAKDSDGPYPGRVCIFNNAIVPAPTITSLATSSGCPGSSLVINGTNLLSANAVKIGGTPAQIISKNESSVTVNVGLGTTGTVEVTTQGGTATSIASFTVLSGGSSDPLGSPCNPFTSLSQVRTATPNGQYSFVLNGNVFNSRIENGFLLIANDVGAALSLDLQELSNLSVTTRGIVSSGVLSNLGNVSKVRIKSSDGVLDVETTDPTIIARVKAGQTIHQGQADNVLNDSWAGTSAANIKEDAGCPTSFGASLKGNLIHTCGSFNGMNWIPNIGYRRINDSQGDVATGVSFGLWVEGVPSLQVIAQTNAAQNITSSTVTLTGEVNPRLLTGTYEFELGPTTVYNQTIVATPPSGSGDAVVPITADVTGLQQNTTYHYRVKVTTADGISYGNDQTFTTLSINAPPTGNLIHNFEFNGNLNDSQPTGELFSIPVPCTNSFGTNPNQWNWTATRSPGGGLFLATANLPNPENYTLALDFSFSDVSGKRKILSFGDFFENKGVYFLSGGIDQVDGSIYGFGTLNANTFYKLILTRDATTKELKTYIIGPSGVLQLLGTLTDTNNDAVPINSSASNRDFTFFLDDASTNNEYTPSGSVRFIKMWDAPLSEAQLTTLFPSPLPTITSLSTLSGCQGSSLIINGANLTGVQSVTIGGTAATVVSTTATSVTVTVGSGTTGTVSVTSPSGTATSTEVYTVASGGALGSVCNPFTNVNQVTDATPNGLYHFDLNGNKFETKVENGWVLVLNDSGASVKQGLQVVNTLDVTTRGILSNSVLSNLGDFNNINVKSSNGVVDAFSNNATLVSRLKASQTLHQGSNDNAINDSWTGIGAVYLTTNATCPSGDGSALNGSVIHICGPSNTLNWIPNRGVREITDAAGFVGAGISFGLWIKKVATPTILSLSSLNGCIGATLVINGTNLATTQTVTVGGTAATVISATETSVTVKIGNGTTGTVQLTTLGGSVTSAETYTISTVFNPSEPLGTGCNPFTSIQQITPATPNGLYFFNLGGNAFETKVEGGWVLVLNDVGASVKQGLQVVNSLDVTTRGILSNSALSNLGNVNAVKVKSSDGVLDAVSSNSAIISRVKAGQTIHKGLVDNAINDSWIGASASSLTGDATCTNTSTDITLNLNVLQLCGNVNGVSWIPIAGERRISFNNGDVADNVSFGLWVKQASPVAGISGRNLWLKANEGVTNSGANVTGWTDQTGTNTFTKQGTIGYQTNGINFNPTASFSNGYTTGVLPPNRLEGNTDINVVQAFAVYKNATSSPARTTSLFGRFDGNNNVTTGLFLGPTNDNTYVYFELNAIADAYLSFPSSINYDKFNLQTIDVSPTVTPFAKAWTNGKNSLVEATPTGGIEYMAIPLTPLIGGTKNSSFFNFNGEVAEIITYNTGLSTFDKIKVESYLAVKYGITLDESVNNYVSSSGSSIWEYRTHWHDVFGIGKDDAISLNQSQSNSINTGSGDGTGQSGKGNIVLSDPTSLDDGDFLMMGHDNAALTEQTTEVPKAGQNRIAREWRVKRSGDPGTVDLSFDIAGLTFSGSTASQFKLLIDADGDFNSGATSVSAGSLSGSKVVFNGVTLPDGFYLTIVTKTPGPGVTGASLWLKANEGVTNSGANLTGWADQTNTNTFTKVGTIGYQNNAINFNQSVVFKNPENKINLPVNRLDGNTDILYVDGFAVYKSNRTKSTLIGGVNAGAKYGQGIFVSDGVPQVLVGSGANSAHSQFNNPNLSSYNIANLDVSLTTSPFATGRLNGLPQTLSHSGGQAFTSLNVKPMIGGTNNKRDPGGWFDFEGEVAEVVLFPSSLTLVDKVKVESYLAIKYGITLAPSVVSYVNSLGTVLWNDTKYWHDVFGIGKDDASSLNQSQSNSINTGSGDGKGQSGKGNIVLSDPTSLNDGDFLMMGHDNAALTEQTTDLPANLSGKKRLSREWKVKKTNTPGTYNLSFDTTGLCLSASTAADFKLLVDSDEDGEFIAATTIDAASYANNILYFTGVDLPNNAVFTFLTSPPTIQLTSAVGTDAQTVCANTALTSIVYTTSKITNAVVTDLPAGVSANFSSNTLTISGTPTASGVFNYTIQLSSTQCPPLADVKGTITVTTLPNKPSITTSGPTSFCAPGSVVLTSSAATGNQWYKDRVAIVGATGTSYTATDTNTYTVIVTQNGCISQESDLVEVTANIASSAPTLSANGNTVICEGGSVRLHTSSLTGNKWFKNGVEIPGETGRDYNATSTGTYTVETINTAGCVSGLSTPIQVTVNPNKIVAPITGADSVCKGSSITLSSTTKTGVWNSSNTGIASIDGSGVVTGVSAGTVTITYSEANSSGCVTSVSKTITVIAQPIQPTITASGVTSFCSPATVTLSSSATTGNQWYKDGNAITGATDSVYTTADSGSYTVISTIDGCASAESAAVVVTVSVPPAVDPIAGAAVVCAGNTIQLSNTILKGVWSTSNTSIATVDGSGRVTGVSTGIATITFTVTTKFGCATSVSKDITVIALPSKPSITAASSTSFCAPGSVVLTSSASTGNQWYKDGTIIAGATTSSYTAADSGIYTVIVTQNGCVSVESDQVTVTANVTPSVPTLNATGNTIICEGGSVRLHTSSLTDNIWFKDGLVIPGVTGSDYIATTTGTYTVESSNTSGCVSGLSVPIVVTINPNRIVAPITGADRVCANASITLSNATSGGVWSSSNTGIASIDGSGEVTGIIGGTVTITYSASNTSGCVTSVSKTITVTPEPVTPVIATSGPTSFCLPGSVVLSSSA
ncbi:beta strand repeat-containing protein, partial [Flavobacterium succinicans]